MADPADAQQILDGVVTHHGRLVGSYYCADRVREADWRIVTALGLPLTLDSQPVNPVSEGAAVLVLTTILTTCDSSRSNSDSGTPPRPPRQVNR